MNDQFGPESKGENFEAEMRQVAEAVEKHRERPEFKGLSDQELLKRAIQSMVPQSGTTEPVSQTSPSSYPESVPPQAKLEVEHLLDIALNRGLGEAVKEASGSSPFVLDAFHDALAGRLYPELKKRGLLK